MSTATCVTWREACLTYLNNRYYDPTLSSFTSVDPLVGKTGTPYLYANGNPTTMSDPSGLCGVGSVTEDSAAAFAACAEAQSKYEKDHPTLKPSQTVDDDPESAGAWKWPANLPTGGDHPFEPKKGHHGKPTKGSQPGKGGKWGWIDVGDNVWVWDPVRGHWDVEHPDNSHTNVKPNGDVEHGDDNFMVGVSAEEWYDFLDEQRWLNGGQYTLYHNILVYPNGEGEVFIPKAPVVTQGLDLSFHLDISCDQTCMDNFYTGGTVALGGLLLVCVFFCIPTPWPVL